MQDSIIEIAVIVSEGDLTHRYEGPNVVIHADRSSPMNDIVRAMHETSNLLTLASESTITVSQAEQMVLNFLVSLGLKAKECPLAGNSVSVDRQFIKRYMPRLANFLHYRTVDVTTVRLLAQAWYPHLPLFQKKATHRALVSVDSVLIIFRTTFGKAFLNWSTIKGSHLFKLLPTDGFTPKRAFYWLTVRFSHCKTSCQGKDS